MTIKPYLSFEGRCEEALEFYGKAIGAKVEMLMHFKDSPEPPQEGCMAPGSENKVMHVSFTAGGSTLMASDGNCSGKPEFKGISLTLEAANEAEADKFFAALSEGGQVQLPMTTTFFSPRFGMVADRFGVSWMVIVHPQQQQQQQQ